MPSNQRLMTPPDLGLPCGCGGPNLDYARQQGAAYADKVIADLAATHDIKEPHWSTMREDHHRHIKELRESIIELFVIEACDSW